MEQKICFRDVYNQSGIKEVIENVSGNTSNKLTNQKSINTLCQAKGKTVCLT